MHNRVRHTALEDVRELARELGEERPSPERYERIARTLRRAVPCDANTVLRREGDALVPVGAEGLVPDAHARRFELASNPRLRRIVETGELVRFDDVTDPDPFDGLMNVPEGEFEEVHACMGYPLTVEGEVVGAITFDAVDPRAFTSVDDTLVETLGALAAAALRAEQLSESLEEAARRQGVLVHQLRREAEERGGGELIGRSSAMQKLREEVELLGGADLPVLITGETGVGKELVARALHTESSRAEAPLIHVNCAALPETIAESELFGHVRGAFTGAATSRAGKFEAADGGTLLLDEVGELPASVQPKLLRVLQSGEIQRVGADRSRHVDVRVLAATNRDLRAEVEAGRFRDDLYHRLGVYPLHVPALRDRLDDVPLLAGYFLDRARLRLGLGPIRLTADARHRLQTYDWPGNVRELEHVMLRAALRASGGRSHAPVTVEPQHLGLSSASGEDVAASPVVPPGPGVDEGLSMNEAVDAYRAQLIRRAVQREGGNWAAAARRLGVDRGNLHRTARRLGLLGSKR